MEESQTKETLSNEDEEKNISIDSKGSDGENLEAIKRFIEEQENEIKQNETKTDDNIDTTDKTQDIIHNSEDISNTVQDKLVIENPDEVIENPDEKSKEITDEQFKSNSSVMDMILTESEAKDAQEEIQEIPKQDTAPVVKTQATQSPNDKGSMSLSIGSKVEVKDFEEDWYYAEIIEVDYEDTEVLVRYEPEWKKHDEWINVSSPRLRPFTGVKPKPASLAKDPELKEKEKEKTPDIKEVPKEEVIQIKEELVAVKVEEKPKVLFEVGERCLARWRDNRRFVATVLKDLGDGNFEVIFDDGVHWTCGIARMSKMKPEKTDTLIVDTSFHSTGSPSPLETPGPSNAPISPLPLYHTHLFDPTRDYLGSKSERREKKRKLNIKEIFNIGQRSKIPKIDKPKVEKPKVEKKPRPKKEVPLKVPKIELKKVTKEDVKTTDIKIEINAEVPDAVASIIGSLQEEEIKTENMEADTTEQEVAHELNEDIDNLAEEVDKMDEEIQEYKYSMDVDSVGVVVDPNDNTLDDEDNEEPKSESDPVLEEEVTLEKFDKPDQKHEEVIDKIKEAINKLEDGINGIENMDSPKVDTPKPEIEASQESQPSDHEVMTLEDIGKLPEAVDITVVDTNIDNIDMDDSPTIPENLEPTQKAEKKKDPSRIKKSKKLRLIHEKKVKRDVERVKNELARMKRKFEEMRREMKAKTKELAQSRENAPLPESCLQPHEWCCRWVNGQPVGKVSEIEAPPSIGADNKPALPKRSVQVDDNRLPPGWSKHMVRRSAGHSAGKWHVVLVSPAESGSKKFYTKADMRGFLENNPDPSLSAYEHAIMDFGVHLKLSRQMGWIVNTPDGIAEGPDNILPAGSCSLSPQVGRKKMNLKKRSLIMKDKKRALKRDSKRRPIKLKLQRGLHTYNSQIIGEPSDVIEPEFEQPLMPLEDGYVYVGSLKVQIIENLLRCPAEGCFKNFRTKTLLQMHIKHYHRELTTKMGATPKVLDLAAARTTIESDIPQIDKKIIKVKIQKPIKREEMKPIETELPIEAPLEEMPKIPRSLDSPKLRLALANRPIKRPRVLLPVRRPDPEPISDSNDDFENIEPIVEVPMLDQALDFETAISTHTVTKPSEKKKGKKSFASFSKNVSEDEEMFAMTSDELDTRSSFPRSGTPDSKIMDGKMAQTSFEINEDQIDNNMYTFTETGERIKIVHMKREEIINCHCGLREEDGLMVQCELCLCWQHALCHNIQRECDVPEKYTCSICLNPRRGRRSRRFIHDQDRLYEGALPGAKPKESLRRAHELAGNLLRIQDALHAMRVKTYVATKKGHPKLYLWAKEWEQAEMNYAQDKLNSEYSDMHVMINGIGKENLPVRSDDDIATPPSEDHEHERISREHLGSNSLLSGLLSSPGGGSLDLALNTSEFDTIANSVQEPSEWQRSAPSAPQPEAAIENDACRERLLRHIQRCHALIDTRLDSIEAQVAELESQDPSFGDNYETADFYPRTKQTVQMLMRDLDTMEELGVIT